jgi:hypothetical protein
LIVEEEKSTIDTDNDTHFHGFGVGSHIYNGGTTLPSLTSTSHRHRIYQDSDTLLERRRILSRLMSSINDTDENEDFFGEKLNDEKSKINGGKAIGSSFKIGQRLQAISVCSST